MPRPARGPRHPRGGARWGGGGKEQDGGGTGPPGPEGAAARRERRPWAAAGGGPAAWRAAARRMWRGGGGHVAFRPERPGGFDPPAGRRGGAALRGRPAGERPPGRRGAAKVSPDGRAGSLRGEGPGEWEACGVASRGRGSVREEVRCPAVWRLKRENGATGKARGVLRTELAFSGYVAFPDRKGVSARAFSAFSG